LFKLCLYLCTAIAWIDLHSKEFEDDVAFVLIEILLQEKSIVKIYFWWLS
jgi:hypothetical protein